MRVDLVAPFFHPVVGGIEDHVAALAAHLRRRGHEPTVHTLDRDTHGRKLAAREELDGVQVRRWPARIRLGYYTTRFEPRLEGQLLHLHAYGTWTNDWVARKHPDRPKILTLHHGLRFPTSTPLHRAYHWWHRRRAGRRTLAAMDWIVAVSPRDVAEVRRLGLPASLIVQIPNGVPPAAFEPVPPTLPPGPWEHYAVVLGRLQREKSVDHAIQAVKQFPGKTGLVIAGPDHGDRARLEALVRRADLEARVRFLGPLDAISKRSLLAGADVLLLPSRFEAQGRVILEAWAQGRPVVASRVGGVPGLVEDGRDGLLYAWGDVDALAGHVRRIVEDKAVAKRLGEAGRHKAAADFREDVLFDRLLALYREPGSPP